MSGGLAGLRRDMGGSGAYSALDAADAERARRKEGDGIRDYCASVERLHAVQEAFALAPLPRRLRTVEQMRELNGTGALHYDELLMLCRRADRATHLEHQIRHTVHYLRSAVCGVPGQTAIEILEDALGEDVP